MNAKEISEELERVTKNMLEDLKPEAAHQLTQISIRPQHIKIHYTTETEEGYQTHVENLSYKPRRYFRDE